jgi:PKD repeat protein
LTAIANQTNPENATVSLPLAGSDPDGNPLTYSATNLPPGAGINASTGVISGTLTFASAGSYPVTATVSDGTLSASQSFTWTVTNVNRAPTLTAIANQTNPENAAVSLPLAGSDPDGNPLTYSATNLPPGAGINASTGLISGTLTFASAGSYPVTATVSDGTLSASQSFTWTVTNVNRAPTLTGVANQTNPENATVSLPLAGSDPDGNPLTYSATNLPPGAGINASTGVISGTLTFASAGSYPVTATVSDGTLSASQSFTWTVTNVNRAPTLTAVANQTNPENATVSLPLSGSDPDGDTVTYGATNLPSGLSVNSSTGLISGTLTFASAGTYTITATVSDGTLSAPQSFTWTVTNVNGRRRWPRSQIRVTRRMPRSRCNWRAAIPTSTR